MEKICPLLTTLSSVNALIKILILYRIKSDLRGKTQSQVEVMTLNLT
jgi:hypothetical protein